MGLSDEEKAALDAISLTELELYKPKQQVRDSSYTIGPGNIRATGSRKRLYKDICALISLHQAL